MALKFYGKQCKILSTSVTELLNPQVTNMTTEKFITYTCESCETLRVFPQKIHISIHIHLQIKNIRVPVTRRGIHGDDIIVSKKSAIYMLVPHQENGSNSKSNEVHANEDSNKNRLIYNWSVAVLLCSTLLRSGPTWSPCNHILFMGIYILLLTCMLAGFIAFPVICHY